MTTIVRPAAPMIQSVSVFICRVSGVSSRSVAESMCAIFPTWVSPPVAVTIITPLPCVTGVCMNAMFVWSPGASSLGGQRRGVLGRGHALAGQRGLVDLQRARRDDPAVGGHLVACREQHDVADDELLGGDLASRRRRAGRARSPSSST